MIYFESLRHFVQEWIEIQKPSDDRWWPWDKTKRLYLLNLYAVSAPDVFSPNTIPTPFISILVNDIVHPKGPVDPATESLYVDYFKQPNFYLPRRYIYNPLHEGKSNMKNNQKDYTSDTYKEFGFGSPDFKLISNLARRRHVRHSMYDSTRFSAIRERLNDLEKATGVTLRIAENLIDSTSDACTNGAQASPDLIVAQAPINGIIYPIGKSHVYKIINGAFVLCKDPVWTVVPHEPSYAEYEKILAHPFGDMARSKYMDIKAKNNLAKAIIYIAAEAPHCTFEFREYFPSEGMTNAYDDRYVYMLEHHFMLKPRVTNNGPFAMLAHEIQESLIMDIPEHRRYFVTHNTKLFKRSDLPSGVYKEPGGTLTVSLE